MYCCEERKNIQDTNFFQIVGVNTNNISFFKSTMHDYIINELSCQSDICYPILSATEDIGEKLVNINYYEFFSFSNKNMCDLVIDFAKNGYILYNMDTSDNNYSQKLNDMIQKNNFSSFKKMIIAYDIFIKSVSFRIDENRIKISKNGSLFLDCEKKIQSTIFDIIKKYVCNRN